MPNPPLSKELAQQIIDCVEQCTREGFKLRGRPSAIQEASRRLGINESTAQTRIRTAKFTYKLEAKDCGDHKPDKYDPTEDVSRPGTYDLAEVVKTELVKQPKTLADLVMRTGADTGSVLDAIEWLIEAGVNIHRVGDRYEIPKQTAPGYTLGNSVELKSRADNTFLFGVAGDKHIASKYHRDDVLTDLYRRFEAEQVDAIFDTGNWIDGEARFNRYDITAHGIDAQVKLLAKQHPKIAGIMTYAVWGDDHEGWYSAREGIDVGKYAEQIMQANGHAWTNLGFMEAHVTLKNANTGVSSTMSVVHPGGGSAYATSYAPQKTIESLEGGEKPAVVLFGHWHKLEAMNIRNVWSIQTGCCQDQTPFARKKRLDFHLGGVILRLEQDPDTGAIVGCRPEMIRYFVKSYYNNRWSHHGPVDRPERSRAGI